MPHAALEAPGALSCTPLAGGSALTYQLRVLVSYGCRSRDRLHQIMRRLTARHHRRGGTVSIGGYSQGACMALDVALTLGSPLKVLLVAGFAMLPQFVTSFGWHGYRLSKDANLAVWILQ